MYKSSHSQILVTWNLSTHHGFLPCFAEKNYTLECSSDRLTGTTSLPWCLENCQKYIPKSCCSPIQGIYMSHTLTTKLTLSPGLDNKETFKCIYDSFAGTLTYLLFLNNCLNFTPNVKFFFNPGDKVIFSAEILCNLNLRIRHTYFASSSSFLIMNTFTRAILCVLS